MSQKLKWYRVPPSQPGWYWMHTTEGRTSLEYVMKRPGHDYLSIQVDPTGFAMKREFRAVRTLNALWSGPFELPRP